jgi:hypothetical protein
LILELQIILVRELINLKVLSLRLREDGLLLEKEKTVKEWLYLVLELILLLEE